MILGSAMAIVFQSTLSMRRATDVVPALLHVFDISIHALHEESDPAGHRRQARHAVISIHALHEESDVFGIG